MSIEDEISQWEYLSNEAVSGNLFLEETVARGCRAAIDAQIGVYEDCLNGIEGMARVSGLGEFECGMELARLFGLQAIGEDSGADLHAALRDHIKILELMGATIQVSLDRVQEQDSSNSQSYNQVS